MKTQKAVGEYLGPIDFLMVKYCFGCKAFMGFARASCKDCDGKITHGLCNGCAKKLYGGLSNA